MQHLTLTQASFINKIALANTWPTLPSKHNWDRDADIIW